MVPAWLALADSAIKIGLGATITGVATYYNSKLNHNQAKEKDRLSRKRELLENVADSVEVFSRRLRDYIALMSDWRDFDDPEKELPGHRKKIEKCQQEFYDGFHELTSAECKLLLVEEIPSRDQVRAYGECAQELYMNIHIDGEKAEEEVFKDIKRRLKKHYEGAFDEMSKAYSRDN